MKWQDAVKLSPPKVAYRLDSQLVHFRFPRCGTVALVQVEPHVTENVYDDREDWQPYAADAVCPPSKR